MYPLCSESDIDVVLINTRPLRAFDLLNLFRVSFDSSNDSKMKNLQ